MKVTRAVVPSLFTVLNMFCGFISIIHASNREIIAASWFIVLAALFDSLDGVMARITKSSSDFGVEIDSLSDVISFGAAPAFLVYQASLIHLEGFGVLISSLLMIFGGLRLARFNSQLIGYDKDHFVGLPIPASALVIVAFFLNFWSEPTGLSDVAATLLPWLIVALALLMVSKVKYETLPKPTWRAIKNEPWKYIFIFLALALVIVSKGKALLLLFAFFILLGVFRYIGGWMKRSFAEDEGLDPEEVPEPSRIEA